MQLFATHCHGTSLDTFVDCDTYALGGERIPYLDVSAAYDNEAGEVIVNVTNRHREQAITTDILCQTGRFGGKATVYEVNGPDIKAENSMTRENRDQRGAGAGRPVHLCLPGALVHADPHPRRNRLTAPCPEAGAVGPGGAPEPE